MTAAPAHLIRGEHTRKRVLDVAVGVATAEGLDALTIGRVAEAAALTKAGLLSHFGSKEQLQLATLQAGRDRFAEQVARPALQQPAGLPRFAALIDGWLAYVDGNEGGCLFASVAAEFDTRRGLVHDAIAANHREWTGLLVGLVESARRLKHLTAGTDAEMLVFKLQGYELSLNLRRQLVNDTQALARARAALYDELRRAATPLGKRLLARRA